MLRVWLASYSLPLTRRADGGRIADFFLAGFVPLHKLGIVHIRPTCPLYCF
jgi:hypothetical protein